MHQPLLRILQILQQCNEQDVWKIAYSTIKINVAIRHSLVAKIPQPTEASAAQIQHQVIETIIQIPGLPYETSNYSIETTMPQAQYLSAAYICSIGKLESKALSIRKDKINQTKKKSRHPHPHLLIPVAEVGKHVRANFQHLKSIIQNTYSPCTQNLEISYCQTQNSLTLDR
ncbi:hypothetical protein FGO68_gene7282 [Halteria grandinella]|uniref:Uncharacterized protein n=1 Tax=Halteria grandinella TaxID=5974 RepID=A0A8J8NXK6_HALGN|nr:hypothetical protein FGO68_gene7282 [Halteria grandinella]